jgi:sporulation integral membrane protein YlbJ
MQMKLRWQQPVLLLLTTGLFWLLLDAAEVRGAVEEGLRLCGQSVIPALFPFLTVSSLLMSLGFGEWAAQPFAPLMRLYRIGGAGASALLLGLVGGYPVGARTAAELYKGRQLSRNEAERLLFFCNNANPAFLVSFLGVGVFDSPRVGIWLWLIHLLAALLTGLLLARRVSAGYDGRCRTPILTARFSTALTGAVRTALDATLGICAFVVFFYVLVLPLRRLALRWGNIGTAVLGVVELFSAAPLLSHDRIGFVLAAGLSGWGGVSVLCQTLAVLSDTGLSIRNCVAGKALQGALSAALATVLAGYILS